MNCWIIQGHVLKAAVGFGLLKECLYQLAEVLSSLRRARARSSLHPLLLALGRPGGEHGGLDGERGLPEVLVFKCFVSADPLGRAVRQESGTGRKQTCEKHWNPLLSVNVSRHCRNCNRRLKSLGMCNSDWVLDWSPKRLSWIKIFFFWLVIGYSSTLGDTLSFDCLACNNMRFKAEMWEERVT